MPSLGKRVQGHLPRDTVFTVRLTGLMVLQKFGVALRNDPPSHLTTCPSLRLPPPANQKHKWSENRLEGRNLRSLIGPSGSTS